MNHVASDIASKLISDTNKETVRELFEKIKAAMRDEGAVNSLVALSAAYASLMWGKFPEQQWQAVMTIWPHLVSQITETWSMRSDGNHRMFDGGENENGPRLPHLRNQRTRR